ncbi:MAG: hypothetical protein ACYTGC_06890 [Planctomycetota bacterium]|jgi:hypothetical protein
MKRGVIAALLLGWALTHRSSAAVQVDAVDASVRVVRSAMTTTVAGAHPMLLSLRQMRESSLGPLFYKLVEGDDWALQVHGVLGLAELSEQRQLDPWLMTQVDAHGHEYAIAGALDSELIPDERMEELLRWEGLSHAARLMLLAERFVDGHAIDIDDVRPLAGPESGLRQSGIAACLLAQLGDPEPLAALRIQLEELDRRQRRELVPVLLEAIRQYRLVSALDLARAALEAPSVDRQTEETALLTLLQLQTTDGLSWWRQRLGTDATYPRRVRFGLLLLATGSEVPAETYDLLGDDEPLVRALAAVGRAISQGSVATDELIALLDVGHPRSADWVIKRVPELPIDAAIRICEHLIDHQVESNPRLTVRAIAHLFERRPEIIFERLRVAEDDSGEQIVLLLGLFECSGPAVPAAASLVPRSGPARPDSLALVLAARGATPLAEIDVKRLGTIAAGGGRVSELLQVQAAWLYLRHTGNVESAVSRIFADS